MNPSIRLAVTLAFAVTASSAAASTTGQLPPWVCAHADAIYAHGFEAQATRYVEASNGSGGSYPGSKTRSVSVSGLGSRLYFVYIPTSYSPSRPMPLMLVMHGAGGPGTSEGAAQAARNDWIATANSRSFIVMAAVGSDDANGSWTVPPPAPSDYNVMIAMLADMKAAYNIDSSRFHGWGYSSGGSVMDDMVFGPYSAGIDIDTFAGIAIHAGGLDGLACSSTVACMALLNSAERKIPVDLRVGDGDTASRPHVLADYNRLQNAGWVANSNVWYTEFVGGHEYEPALFGGIWDHLCPFQRLP